MRAAEETLPQWNARWMNWRAGLTLSGARGVMYGGTRQVPVSRYFLLGAMPPGGISVRGAAARRDERRPCGREASIEINGTPLAALQTPERPRRGRGLPRGIPVFASRPRVTSTHVRAPARDRFIAGGTFCLRPPPCASVGLFLLVQFPLAC